MNQSLEEVAELLLLIHECYFETAEYPTYLRNLISFTADIKLFGNVITYADIEILKSLLIRKHATDSASLVSFNYDMFYDFLKMISELVYCNVRTDSQSTIQRLLIEHIIPLCRSGLSGFSIPLRLMIDAALMEYCVTFNSFLKCVYWDLCKFNKNKVIYCVS